MGKSKKEFKVKRKKVVFYDDENSYVKKMSVTRQRDCDGEVMFKLKGRDGDKLFWLNTVQIEALVYTLTEARGKDKVDY